MMLTLVESAVFLRRVEGLLTPEEHRAFQAFIAQSPEAGAVIKGGGGLRKVRWGREGHGKSSGVRVIYYVATQRGLLHLLLIYAKSEQDDLTPEQLEVLRKMMEK